jgi:hypothetical protein
MCCCDRPTVNGQYGYKWCDGRAKIHPVDAPAIEEGDIIILDEPGRCRGIDSHSYHFRLVQREHGGIALLVRHGGGDEAINRISNQKVFLTHLCNLDSDGRYWVMCALYHAYKDAARRATEHADARWRQAAAEKRIKTRKMPGRNIVRVWIADKTKEEAR